jgi:hypothetical protein
LETVLLVQIRMSQPDPLSDQIQTSEVHAMMGKKNEQIATVPSWYPSTNDVLQTQRAQMEISKRQAMEFASQTIKPGTSSGSHSWWRRLFRTR